MSNPNISIVLALLLAKIWQLFKSEEIIKALPLRHVILRVGHTICRTDFPSPQLIAILV